MCKLVVNTDGTIQFIYQDSLRSLLGEGTPQITRVSHVEPNSQGEWIADLSPVGGPLLGPYPLRQAALDAEVAWLDVNIL